LDGWRLDKSIDEGRERWMDGWRLDGSINENKERWMDGWKMDGMMDIGMDEWMDGVLKNIKIGIIFYMPNKFMKAKREKYIQEKYENNLGIYFFFVQKKYQVEGRKG
jgi:hypothetical protein